MDDSDYYFNSTNCNWVSPKHAMFDKPKNWKELVEKPGLFKYNISKKAPPFYWLDGDILEKVDRDEFLLPDVRSEFVPIFPISSPLFKWQKKEIIDGKEHNFDKKNTFLDPNFSGFSCIS